MNGYFVPRLLAATPSRLSPWPHHYEDFVGDQMKRGLQGLVVKIPPDESQVPIPHPPAIVYKYLGIEAGNHFLANQSLRFTQPSELNDPFECNPTPGFYVYREILLRDIGDYPIYPDVRANARAAATFTDEVIDQLDHNYGILALSNRWWSTLMWSHYAEKHRGFVVGFDATHPFFQAASEYANECGPLEEVTYAKRRLSEIPKDLTPEVRKALFMRKDQDWLYEGEYRLVRPAAGMHLVGNDMDPRTCIRVSTIPIEAVAEIYIGVKTADPLRRRLHDFASNRGCRVYDMFVHPISFNMGRFPARARVEVKTLSIETLAEFGKAPRGTDFVRLHIDISVDGVPHGTYWISLRTSKMSPMGVEGDLPEGYTGPWDHSAFVNRAFWYFRTRRDGAPELPLERMQSRNNDWTMIFDFFHHWREGFPTA